MPYMAYSPTAQGLLAGRFDLDAIKFSTRRSNPFYSEPLFSKAKAIYNELEVMAGTMHCKPINIALSWVLNRDNILTAIVGSRKLSQIKELGLSTTIELDSNQLEKLQILSDEFIARASLG